MRVLFTVSPWRGHYFCMVPLGWAFAAAGHDVRVACPQSEIELVRSAGLVPAPVLESVDWKVMGRIINYLDAERSPHITLPLHPYTGKRVSRLDEFDAEAEWTRFQEKTRATIRRSYDGAVSFARKWRPDIVLHDLTAPEGMAAAELLGVPSVYHPPGLYGTVETEHGVDLGDGDPTESFPRYNLRPYTTERIAYAVDPSPETVIPPMGSTLRLPERYVPYNGAGTIPDWLLKLPSQPRVCVLWGGSTAFQDGGVPILRAAIEAVLDEGAEVVLTAHADQLKAFGPMPPGVRALDSFPLYTLLETCDAIIHHGSVNGLLTAGAAGVPQLSLPSEDRAIFCKRMAATGAVAVLTIPDCQIEEVRERAVAVLTGPAYADAARRLRDANARQPSPARLVPLLHRLARKGSLTGSDIGELYE